MSRWNDAVAWQGLLDGSTCPICVRGAPLDVVATLGSAWLTMSEHAPMVGYACLVSRVHAVELFDLSDDQAHGFIDDARRVAKALAVATGAVKLNYEIHGNTLPHLHMHFFPRYPGDPFEGRAIEPGKVVGAVYAADGFAILRDRVLGLLGGC